MGVQECSQLLIIGPVLLIILVLFSFVYRFVYASKPKEIEELPFMLDITEDLKTPNQAKDLEVEKITIRSKRLKRLKKFQSLV